MPIRPRSLRALQLLCFIFLGWMQVGAQAKPEASNYSGMYGFLHEGEFVQITVETGGSVIGFVSRFADPEGEGGFLDHFFKTAKLDGNQLTFTTQAVGRVSFEFKGTIERGEGKVRSDQAYYVLKGTLIENSTIENKTADAKTASTHSYEVALKSFPLGVAPAVEPPK
jgi:hypothetical protein